MLSIPRVTLTRACIKSVIKIQPSTIGFIEKSVVRKRTAAESSDSLSCMDDLIDTTVHLTAIYLCHLGNSQMERSGHVRAVKYWSVQEPECDPT